MNLSTDDVITRFRNEVDDIVRGTGNDAENAVLWTTVEAMGYLNEAVAQVATETRSLYKTFDIPYSYLDGPYVRLPSSYEILDINEVYLVGRRNTLSAHNVVDGMYHHDDYGYYGADEGWEVATGVPTRYSRDFRPGFLRLYPTPTDDDILRLTAVVGAVDMQSGMPMPFQHPKDIRLVLEWMKHLAYSKKDVDTFDPTASVRYEEWFNKHVLDRRYECQRIRRAPGAVRFSW